jgi:hypothetical protein
MTDLNTLASMVADERGMSNAFDVKCEIALFEPDSEYIAVRANAAGSKVIYTMADGKEKTCWARDWTISHAQRQRTAAALRSRAAMGEG